VTGLQPLARPLVQWASQFRLKIYTAIKTSGWKYTQQNKNVRLKNIHSKRKLYIYLMVEYKIRKTTKEKLNWPENIQALIF
jgi:hypothetical protein